jgi:hypothetical protein
MACSFIRKLHHHTLDVLMCRFTAVTQRSLKNTQQVNNRIKWIMISAQRGAQGATPTHQHSNSKAS